MITTIYTLSHPTTKEVRYVGRTIRALKSRLSGHISQSRRSDAAQNNEENTLCP